MSIEIHAVVFDFDGLVLDTELPVYAAWCAAFEAHVAAIPLGRMGDPEADIAPVLLFLLSDASRYITGQIIRLDGGRSIT